MLQLFSFSFKDSVRIFKSLCKILIPVIVLLRVIQPFGVIELASNLLANIMEIVGLPGYTAIVWASAILGSLYTGLAVLIALWHQEPLSIAQVSVLCLMLLVAHNLLVECVVAHKSGSNLLFSGMWRMLCAFLMGWLAFQFLEYFNLYQEIAVILLEVPPIKNSLFEWLVNEIKSLFYIFIIIFLLTLLLNFLKKIKVEKYLHQLLFPFLRLFKLKENSANITLIGLILGIALGAGFLIDEVKNNKITHLEGFKVMNILNLNHSVIEDTLLMLLVGSTLWIILVFRIIVGTLLSLLLCFFIDRYVFLQKYLISK